MVEPICCLSSCSYIKPQLNKIPYKNDKVVYHLVPTSNHNFITDLPTPLRVVYHLVPTSNHNGLPLSYWVNPLFIILFLHQTTTFRAFNFFKGELFIILFLHQTTTAKDGGLVCGTLFIILFLHQTTTCPPHRRPRHVLFIILFLHQTTTQGHRLRADGRCLSSCSYIKPQPIAVNLLAISKILCFKLLRNGRAGRILLQKY